MLLRSLIRFFLLITFSIVGCNREVPAVIDYDESMYGHLILGDSVIAPGPQTQQERIVIERPTEIVRKFGSSPEEESDLPQAYTLFEPASAVVDVSEKYLYILDQGALEVKQFEIATGRLIQRFGKGQGSGPGEFEKPTMFALLKDGGLWVLDSRNRNVTLFDARGEVLEVNNVPFQVNGLVASVDGRYALSTNQGNNLDLFKIFSGEGKELMSFGRLATRASASHLAFIGQMTVGDDDAFMLTGFNGGGLLKYAFDGRFHFFRETLDHSPFPRWVPDAMEGQQVYTLDASASSVPHIQRNVWEGIYYEVVIYSDGEPAFYLDAYSFENGDYLHSLVLPNECGPYFITKRHVFANCKVGFVQFLRTREESN